MVPQWIIEKKRDGESLAEADIRAFIDGYTRGDIPDYQMSALAMAIYFQGMSTEEVAVLTDAMMRSGELVDTSAITRPKVDKHSTGGIGDKVSLILAPLVACCGVAVPMLSGRGLGITGGTLDKLESIPGYRTDLDIDRFLEVIDTCGCSIIGQTATLAPADKKLYALRDVTGTVPSIPLIAASIMSKKLAEGMDALVLDVKWGSGAFMKTPALATELADTMVRIGTAAGKGMAAIVTDMNQPLGRTAGNALEVVETIETLRGNGPADLVDITLELAAHMLTLTGIAPDIAIARDRLTAALNDGRALDTFKEMVALQGGDCAVIDDPSRLPVAAHQKPCPAPGDGFIGAADAEAIGRACIALGAGRQRVEDRVDHAVGISGILKIGEPVSQGQPMAIIHANSQATLDAARPFMVTAFQVSADPVVPPDLMGKVIT
ncbi:MAG: thymidine phosphorylase [Verrucomicrobia bacterium]|jgi:pyrimidine-nucleoside phosphorylase|nr:thymidine phosphorylase [Verrucomicrobiota bacterium]MBT7068564.1 thymidine phosphorylase [Verrucomicrobiota bacterium]MBT7699568.1 thymidine phosphorylase [Verrucomicrobiota bacterium]